MGSIPSVGPNYQGKAQQTDFGHLQSCRGPYQTSGAPTDRHRPFQYGFLFDRVSRDLLVKPIDYLIKLSKPITD